MVVFRLVERKALLDLRTLDGRWCPLDVYVKRVCVVDVALVLPLVPQHCPTHAQRGLDLAIFAHLVASCVRRIFVTMPHEMQLDGLSILVPPNWRVSSATNPELPSLGNIGVAVIERRVEIINGSIGMRVSSCIKRSGFSSSGHEKCRIHREGRCNQ